MPSCTTTESKMRRKSQHHENHERWLVSYADFVTLLFAFFVVMFTSAQADKGKAGMISQSVKKALEKDRFSSAVASLWGGTVGETGVGNAMVKGPGGVNKITEPPPPPEAEFAPSMQYLKTSLTEELAKIGRASCRERRYL